MINRATTEEPGTPREKCWQLTGAVRAFHGSDGDTIKALNEIKD